MQQNSGLYFITCICSLIKSANYNIHQYTEYKIIKVSKIPKHKSFKLTQYC